MIKKRILMKVRPEGFYLNPSLLIALNQTNLPSAYLTFHPQQPIFWLSELLDFNAHTGSLHVTVLDYYPVDTTSFETQTPKKEIQSLHFEKLDWTQLKPQLSHYQKIRLKDILFNDDELSGNWQKGKVKDLEKIAFPTSGTDVQSVNTHKIDKRELKETFWVPFSEINICLGYVAFRRYLSILDRTLDFQIYNDHLLPEFNMIRFWFARKLMTKRLSVTARIKLEGDEVITIKATSQQIDQIGPELIDSIKYQRTYALTKEPKIKMPDKSLFTADEMFGLLSTEDEEGNIFRQSEEDILAMLLEKSNVRNKKQLAYLAGKKQSAATRLRYTLYPHFGFLFFIEGEENHHFVWELLNSHATYMWSLDKKDHTLDHQYQRIERTINTIRSNGREAYKQAYREQHTDQDLVFHFIPHEDIDSKFVDGFPKWKQRLNEQLI